MRLLHVESLKLETFVGEDVPRYAIVSHTWGEDEFLFEDVTNGDGIFSNLSNPKRGFQKVLNACKQAERDKLDYIWIDTCCIDKSNGAELSEAINSMFKWYQRSAACYAFLEDATLEFDGTITNFDDSKWFKRGWTLQELIAPHELRFFDCQWRPIQTRNKLFRRVAEITGIKEIYLTRRHAETPDLLAHGKEICRVCGGVDNIREQLTGESIASRMRWASRRQTTLPEDTAYCLMGLFDVNIPLLYGEGTKAFTRLQEEIIKTRPDQSILAWTGPEDEKDSERPVAYLSPSPSAFESKIFDKDDSRLGRDNLSIMPRGVEADLLLMACPMMKYTPARGAKQLYHNLVLGILKSSLGPDSLSRVAIVLRPTRTTTKPATYVREFPNVILVLDPTGRTEVISSLAEDRVELTVQCDMESFKEKRIILQSIPNSIELNHDIPLVKVVVEGFGNWRIKAQYPEFSEGDVLARNFEVSDEAQEQFVVGRGIFCLSDNNSCFVAILVADNVDKGYLRPKARYYCWIETWQSFIDMVGDSVSDPTPEALKAAQLTYIKGLSKRNFVRPPSEYTAPEADYRARARVKSSNFLGRTLHTVDVEIQSSLAKTKQARRTLTGGDARWYQLSKKIDNYAEESAAYQYS